MKRLFFVALVFFVISNFAQEKKAPALDEFFPQFSLKDLTGKTITNSDIEGKNTIFVSLRGRYNSEIWCAMCYYTYAEFINSGLTDKFNIVFLFPYGYDQFEDWKTNYPVFLKLIEKWKHPGNESKLNEEQKNWMLTCRRVFPNNYLNDAENPTFPLVVLSDQDQKFSKILDLNRDKWDGTEVKQNIPCIYLLDKNGKIRFKYLSQHTFDRPSIEYIRQISETVL